MGRPRQSGGAGSGRPPSEGGPSGHESWPEEYEAWPPEVETWPAEHETALSDLPPGHGDVPPGHGGDVPPGQGDVPPGRYGIPPAHGDMPPGHGGDVPPGHGGGGLTRGGEQFQRVYSPPEPPKTARRRPRALMILVAVVSFAVAAGLVFLLAPAGGRTKAGPTETGTQTPAGTGEPSSSAPPKPSAPPRTASKAPQPTAKPFTALSLPDACGTVSGTVLNRVTPGASKKPNSNNTLATCTFTSQAPFRWLLVEMYLYPSTTLPDPVGDAKRNFSARWTQAHNTPLERTFTLEQVSGLGDEAFRSFQEDKGQPLVVGEVTARHGNVVIRVGYSRQLSSGTKPESVQQSALTNATDAAREVLSALR